MNFDTIQRDRQAAPQLYEALRDRIVSLRLAPGTVLSRNKLAATFDVSQTPVREALLRLTEEHLVDVFPQSSTRVSLISVEFAHEAHFLRRSIELELVRELAIKPDVQLVKDLTFQVERQKVLRDAKDYTSFAESDQLFHRIMYTWTGKEALWKLVRSRSGDLDRVRRLHLPIMDKPDRIIEDHQRIVQAVAEGNPEGAQKALREHLSETPEYIANIQKDYPSYFKNE